MARLSRRCLRGFRTAPRAAAAPSPRHEPEHWLLLLAAVGTAWREKGRPRSWEACCSTCAWSEGCKGTALDLESRDTGSSWTARSNYYRASTAKLDLKIESWNANAYVHEQYCENSPVDEGRSSQAQLAACL